MSPESDWRRLDPRMLLVHPVTEVVRYLPALVALFLVGPSGSHSPVWVHAAWIVIPIGLGLLRYWRTSYRITPSRLELRHGVLGRRVLTAQLDRIRTVELTAPPIHRILGLAKVRIGTGSAHQHGEERFVLDALAAAHARALRTTLLHHRAEDGPAGRDDILLRLDPGWVRYAPLTTSGIAIALAALGLGNQLITESTHRFDNVWRVGERALAGPTWALAIAGVVVLLVLVSLLSIGGYLITNWGLTLSRDPSGRSLQLRRGLFTSQETSIEIGRLRGVEVHEPLGLRLARAGRLGALVTGMSRRQAASAVLVPPAPEAVVRRVAADVLGGSAALDAPLVPHGPAATRRRYTRALAGGSALGLLIGGVLAGAVSPWWWLAGLVPVLLSVPVGHDRARRLGHALTEQHLVIRAHTFQGRRIALERSGVIGWNIRQSWLQHRSGVVTMTATVSAGRHGYRIVDIPEAAALALARATTPGLLEPFLSDDPAVDRHRRVLHHQ